MYTFVHKIAYDFQYKIGNIFPFNAAKLAKLIQIRVGET